MGPQLLPHLTYLTPSTPLEPRSGSSTRKFPILSLLACSLHSGCALSPDALQTPPATPSPLLQKGTQPPEAEVTRPLCRVRVALGLQPSACPYADTSMQGPVFNSLWGPPPPVQHTVGTETR